MKPNAHTEVRIEFVAEQLRARVTGVFDSTTAKTELARGIAKAMRLGIRKVLVDARALQGEISILERFALGEDVAALTRGRIAIAIVDLPERVWPDRFVETVAANRGALIKVTTDYTEALAWLDAENRVDC